MHLIILDQDETRAFDAQVKVLAPGESEPAVFIATFLELPKSQLTDLLSPGSLAAAPASGKEVRSQADRTEAIVRRILKGLSGILDKDKKEIPWSDALLDAVLQRPYIRDALIRTYTNHITGDRELGN